MNSVLLSMLTDAPWAIEKSAMDSLFARARGVDENEIRAAVDRLEKADPKKRLSYEVRSGAAIIKVQGELTKEASLFSMLFGGGTYAGIQAQVEAALSDASVDKIVLKVFSPGGMVPGVLELAAFLFRAGQKKPIYTYADGQMTSAAYWLGSVAKKVYAPRTALLGSIGVRWTHIDESKLNDKIGIRITHMTAGKYKAVGNPDGPLSKNDKAYLQERWDSLYTIFIDSVAGYRGMTTGAVLAAADGKIFLADQAKENGLIDTIVSDFDEFLQQINSNQEDQNMDYNELKTQHPELFKQVRDEGYQEGQTAAASAQGDGGMDRETVLEFVGLVAGDDGKKKVCALMDTNLKPAQIQALQGIFGGAKAPEKPADGSDAGNGGGQAQTPAGDGSGQPAAGAADPDLESRQRILDGINSQGTPPLTQGNNGAGGGGGQPQDFNALVTAYMTEHKCGKAEAIQKVKSANPEAHKAYLKAANNKTA
jgi:signal peptide peptidase SppA